MTDSPTPGRFAFDWDAAYRWAALPFGITPSNTWVQAGPDGLEVRFGLWRLHTSADNVEEATRSGGYGFLKTAGPPHLSFSDRGISFATNGRHGICLSLRKPVPGIDPTGTLTHPGVTLTVSDPAGLCRALGVELS